MQVLFVSRDLMFGSQVDGAARRAGASYKLTGAEQAVSLASDDSVVILDLSTPGLDAAALVGELQASEPPPKAIVAYAPHVHEQKLTAAREAGCDAVFTRGQFHSEIGTLLERLA